MAPPVPWPPAAGSPWWARPVGLAGLDEGDLDVYKGLMKAHRLTDSVQYWGAPDWNRRLFDSLIPIPEGTSYNAYLVRGSDKTVLIDTVEPEMAARFEALLDGLERLDHVVSLHAEQDHSGSIPQVLERFPEATLVTSPKAKGMLLELMRLPADRIETVADGDTLSLGDRTLRFMHTPWVHWPETMVAYLEEERVLFSCDFFGSHFAACGPTTTDAGRVMEAARRYYAGIMMPFGKFIDKHLTRLAELPIDIIAPSHGPVHQPPDDILNAYRKWVSGPLANRAVIVYETMHFSTEAMVEQLAGGLIDRGIEVELFRLTEADHGRLAVALIDAATVVFGTPTVLGGPHPNVVHAAYLISALRPRAKLTAIVSSSGWSAARTTKIIAELTASLSAEALPPVMGKGFPGDAEQSELDKLAEVIALKHREFGLGTAGD